MHEEYNIPAKAAWNYLFEKLPSVMTSIIPQRIRDNPDGIGLCEEMHRTGFINALITDNISARSVWIDVYTKIRAETKIDLELLYILKPFFFLGFRGGDAFKDSDR